MTEQELRQLWAERDKRYGFRKGELWESAIEAVRLWRLSEALDYAPDLASMARSWLPPVVGR